MEACANNKQSEQFYNKEAKWWQFLHDNRLAVKQELTLGKCGETALCKVELSVGPIDCHLPKIDELMLYVKLYPNCDSEENCYILPVNNIVWFSIENIAELITNAKREILNIKKLNGYQ